MTSQDRVSKKCKVCENDLPPRRVTYCDAECRSADGPARDESGRLISRTSRWRRSAKGRRGDAARQAVRRALRSGALERPERCTECYTECHAEAHHWSYDPADHLRVTWLCRRCHYRADQIRMADPDAASMHGIIARMVGLAAAARRAGLSEIAAMW